VLCMRPETIEKALEFVHEEMNTLYLQHRNESIPDKKALPRLMVGQPNNQGFRFLPNLSHNNSIPMARPSSFNNQGQSRPPFASQAPNQWKPNYNHFNQPGPSRTQQMFGAPPPNYSAHSNAFRIPPRNATMNFGNRGSQERPMSGVSHFVPRNLPLSNQMSGHDWRRSGNQPPTNYFKTREMNYNDCFSYEPYFEDYYPDQYQDYYPYESAQCYYEPEP
jgi:hypothetical protein